MKVLHILDQSIPYTSGYSSRSQYIVEFQTNFKIKPFVVTAPWYSYEKHESIIKGVIYHRTQIPKSILYRLAASNYLTKMFSAINFFKKDIERICKLHSIDIIHAHSPVLCGLAGIKVARKLNLPFIYEVRALWEDAAVDQDKTNEHSIRYHLTRYFETKIIRAANANVVICEGLKKEFVSRGISADKLFIVPNGVDSNLFVPQQKDLSLLKQLNLNNEIIIGFIGTFYKFEGIECLLRALPQILRNYPNVKLLLIGGGLEEPNLKKLVSTFNLKSSVIFTGRIAHNQINKYYSIIDILVYPRISKRITEQVTPIKPLEAMAMEKAILGSNVGGIKELIDDGNTGLLFNAGDINALVEKCSYIIENENLRKNLGLRARQKVISTRNWENIVAKYSVLYESILKRE